MSLTTSIPTLERLDGRMTPRDLDPASFDRTDLASLPDQPDALPHDVIFHRLHYLANHHSGKAVKESHIGLEVSYQQLLSDIIRLRVRLLGNLNEQTLERLRRDEEVAFVIMASGYEFIVALFATLSIGGISVPTSPQVTLEEARHVAVTCRAHATIFSLPFEGLAHQLSEHMAVSGGNKAIAIPQSGGEFLDPRAVRFFAGKTRDPNKPGVIIFTSGSTGKPKGAAMRRYNMLTLALMQIWKNDIKPGFVILQMLPTHHASGLMLNTIPILIGGGCVEITAPKFDVAAIWDRVRQGGITSISAVPTIFSRLLQYWEHVLEKLPNEQKEEYRSQMCNISQFHCGSAALARRISSGWEEAFPGTRIVERYGGTEFVGPFVNHAGTKFVQGSAGVKNPGVEFYLENGDTGEVCIRSPMLFSKYVYDIEATRASLTPDGYFKTGDIAEKNGDHYFIKGRKSIDILKSGGFKISALDIEREILEHPKVAEAIVVGVDDLEYGQRIAAAVVLKPEFSSLSLKELRDDLRSKLSTYKLPTILRVVPSLPKTASLKVPKILLRKELFETGHADIQRWRSGQSKL